MSASLRPAQVLGYASLSPNGFPYDQGCVDLQNFAKNVTVEIEILAEEYHPAERRRPFFNEIRRIIAKEESKVLVVPNLFHIAAGEKDRLLKFLNFLEFYDVRLLSLTERIDSDLVDKESILRAATPTCPPPQLEIERSGTTCRP